MQTVTNSGALARFGYALSDVTRAAARDTATANPATGRRNNHLQRDRGGGRVDRGHARLILGVDRLRTRFRRRDLVGRRGCLAVLRQGPRDAGEGRAAVYRLVF